jgi:hypothetical protein
LAITIDTPGGGLIGPSITIVVRSDVVGPIPPNSQIQVDIFPEGIEQPCGGWSIPISSGIQNVKLSQDHANRQTLFSTIADGGRVTVKTEIHSTAGTFDEGTTTGLTWSTTGLLTEQLRELSQASTQSGFTEDDRAQLAIVAAAVQVPFPISTVAGGISQVALGRLFDKTPLGLMQKLECQNISGDGSLTRPVGPVNVNAFGLTWQFITVPEFFGREIGAVIEYENRIVQFKVVSRTLNGADEVIDLVDAHSDQQFLQWGLASVDRVEFSVTPGCEVQVCWLLLL